MDAVLGALLQSCADGDPDTLYSCLQYGLDLNFITEESGITPLMYAVVCAGNQPQGDYYSVVQLLLEAGAHPDVVDALSNRTAAHYAAHYKQPLLLQLLIAKGGCDVAVYDVEGESPFHVAVNNSLDQCVELMIESSPALVNYPTYNGTAPIILAARAGNIKLCQMCLEQGCDPNTIDPLTLQSPLHAAAESGHAPIVGMLLRKQQTILDASDARGLTPVHLACSNTTSTVLSTICDKVGSTVLELTDASGLTPLMCACLNGSEACVDFIVRKKVDLLAKDNTDGKTCLHWAAESVVCSLETITMLCKKKKQLMTETDAHGRIPLHLAAISGNIDTLKVLLDLGSDPNAIDNNKYTAIHWAVVSGQYNALEELMTYGCPYDVPEKNGATPLHLAAQASSSTVGDDEDGTLELISNGARQCMKILIDAGVNVATGDKEGRQPLHWAVQCNNNLEAIKLLIAGGADPNAKMGDGLPCLHVAAKHGMTENCKCLIEEFNVDGNSSDNQRQTPLFYSIESQAIDCSNYLLSIGCSANHRNTEGRSPVHIAATVGSLEGLELLSSYNGDMNVLSSQYVTPLHDAAVNGQTGALIYILAAGGDPNPPPSEDAKIPSPLHYAVSEGFTDCVQLLIEAGANVNTYIISDEKDTPLTPLDYAAEYPNLKELLLSHNALPGTEIEIQKPQELVPQETGPEATELQEEIKQEVVEIEEHKRTPTPSGLRQQVSRERIDPFEMTDIKQQEKPRSLISRIMSFRKQAPSPDSIQSSVIGLYSAQATMLVGGFIGTPLGDKTVEIAKKVATDTAEELKKVVESQEEIDGLTLQWLETPVEVPSPSPEPLAEVPPTPEPSPPPKIEFHMTQDERRMKKAKAQMDETKSLAFRALEELLRAQKTQSRLRRQFVMAQLKENAIATREEITKREQEANDRSNQLLSQYNKRMEDAACASEKINTQITQQLESAYKVNREIAHSMSKLGISSRPTVSEWLRKKDEEKRTQVKSTLHNWQRERQQREVAISLKQAVTSHRALQHLAWGTKKELSLQNNALIQKRQVRIGTSHLTKHKMTPKTPGSSYPPATSHTAAGKTVAFSHTRKIISQGTSKPKPISTGGCIRATPFGFVKSSQYSDEPPNIAGIHHHNTIARSSSHRSSSLPDTTLWNMGATYVGNKTYSQGGPHHRAYGPKTVHAETTLQFLPPDEYKKKRRALVTSLTERGVKTNDSNSVDSFVPSHHVQVNAPVEQEREQQQKQRLSPVISSSQTILPMKIIEQPMRITA